jgi:hypothetical protein
LVRRQDNGWDRIVVLDELVGPDDVQTSPARHAQIQDHQGVSPGELLKKIKRLFSIIGQFDMISPRFEKAFQDGPVHLMVIGHQNGWSGLRPRRCREMFSCLHVHRRGGPAKNPADLVGRRDVGEDDGPSPGGEKIQRIGGEGFGNKQYPDRTGTDGRWSSAGEHGLKSGKIPP